MKSLCLICLAALGCLLVGCQKSATSPAAANASSGTNSFFLVHGVVKKINPEAKTVTIQHEEIPNFMPAMTMPFKVKDATLLEGLEPGASVWFALMVTADESWIEKLKKDPGASPTPITNAPAAPPEREAVRVARDVEPLREGDLMTNYTFTNELGSTVNLSDFKGQALAFTFIFTRCPLPDFCPRMSRNFSEVYQTLTRMPNAPTNWHLLSISFDPHHDTPAVLRAYARAFQYDPSRWNFVTGAMIDIDAITDQFELIIVKQGEEWDHKVRTVVVDAAGRVQKIIYGNEWKPETLVQEILKAAAAKPEAPPEPQPEPAP